MLQYLKTIVSHVSSVFDVFEVLTGGAVARGGHQLIPNKGWADTETSVWRLVMSPGKSVTRVKTVAPG